AKAIECALGLPVLRRGGGEACRFALSRAIALGQPGVCGLDEESLDALRKEDMTTTRLTVVGPAGDLKEFSRKEEWTAESGARFVELLEHSADRHAWQFETDEPPLKFLKALSRRWRSLT